MAFDRQPPVTAVAIGNIQIVLFDPNPNQTPNPAMPTQRVQSATALIDVVMSDGSTQTVRANIPDHFSAAVVNQLKAFVASVRAKARAEILPP